MLPQICSIFLKNHLYLNLVILKLKCNNLIFNKILVLYASYVCLLHSRFIENHSIWILEDGPLIFEVVLSHNGCRWLHQAHCYWVSQWQRVVDCTAPIATEDHFNHTQTLVPHRLLYFMSTSYKPTTVWLVWRCLTTYCSIWSSFRSHCAFVGTRVRTGTPLQAEGGSGEKDSVDNLFLCREVKGRLHHIFTHISQ
jgi:hypothetical protein